MAEKKKKFPTPAEMAELFIAESPVLWWRENGCLRAGNKWRKAEMRELRHRACQLIDGLAERPIAQPRYVGNVIEAVADRSWISGELMPPCWRDGRPDRDVLAVENGVYSVRTGTLGPHDPMLFNLTAADFPYIKGATCEKTDKWISWFARGNQELIDLLWEIFAYCVMPSLQFQKWFLLLGDGNNGKQCLLRLLAKLVGGNVSAVPLESLGQRFAMAGLVGKNANLIADLNTDFDKADEGRLKMLCDGSDVFLEEIQARWPCEVG